LESQATILPQNGLFLVAVFERMTIFGQHRDGFDAKRGLLEALDVQVTLSLEGGEKVAYARCIVGEDSWPVSHST
jgi:hypothetical protein